MLNRTHPTASWQNLSAFSAVERLYLKFLMSQLNCKAVDAEW